MSDAEDYQPSCYDCGRETARRNLQTREVIVTHDEGLGYEEVTVMLCSRCIGERFGYDCPQCGIRHDDKESARFCCERRPSEAPDCRQCGRRMTVGSASYDPATGTSVTWAECECCPVGWGAFTGWELLDGDPCKHVETDPRGTGGVSEQ